MLDLDFVRTDTAIRLTQSCVHVLPQSSGSAVAQRLRRGCTHPSTAPQPAAFTPAASFVPSAPILSPWFSRGTAGGHESNRWSGEDGSSASFYTHPPPCLFPARTDDRIDNLTSTLFSRLTASLLCPACNMPPRSQHRRLSVYMGLLGLHGPRPPPSERLRQPSLHRRRRRCHSRVSAGP